MTDPRLETLAAADAEARPLVGRNASLLPMAIVGVVLTASAIVLFLGMSARREAMNRDRIPDTPAQSMAMAPPPQPLPPSVPTTPQPVGPPIPGPQFTTSNASAPSPPLPPPISGRGPMIAPGSLVPSDPRVSQSARRAAPTLVVDLGPAERGAGAPGAAAAALPGAAAGQDLSSEEKFAARMSAAEPERATARAMRNLDRLIPQGTVIPAVLETAINSDLPGFTRAVVAADVRGFDGSAVLIPRGSRMIGQYKSGVALGASRVFVIWTRIIRPDGVSIELASPATDPLGRGGLEGKVDRHFFTRFGGSILLSVLNGAIAAASDGRPTAQIIIGTTADATSLASSAMSKDASAPPTIKTPQGAGVRVFVAQDLDFSAAGAFRR